MWLHLRPIRLPRSISTILLGIVYHPPSATSEDNDKLYTHVQETVDSYLSAHPESLIYVVGDFNPNSTNISATTFKRRCGLTQTVLIPTRDTVTLDWCLTNRPKILSKIKQLPKIGSSDHYCFLIDQHTSCVKPSKRTVIKRDTRNSRILEFGQWITRFSWNEVYSMTSCEDKFACFLRILSDAIDRLLPVTVSHSNNLDKPWLTSKIKTWISKRQRCLQKYGKDSHLFKLWRNKVQYSIKECKKNYYNSKVRNLKETNISRWWKEVKSLSGVSCNDDEWFHQLIDESTADPTTSLCDQINAFFTSLTSDFTPLSSQNVTELFVDDSRIPAELFVTPTEASIALSSIKVRKSVGPDLIPNIILKEFAIELAPIVADIYNASLREGYIPSLLKQATVIPIPKQKPPKSIENDIRPISLTCQITKVMEGFTLSRILPSILQKLDVKQFAVSGKSTEHALAYILHLTLEALDKGNCAVRLFFADFRKGFDLIDHKILLKKLLGFNLHPCLVRWIGAFLLKRSQFVRLGSHTSTQRYLNGGIPQGTKLGPILFAVMVNDLIDDWGPRTKFVDDLTAMEIIPRNSPSVMGYIVSDIQSFANNNNMELNPKKCKEMSVDFLHYNSCVWRPLQSRAHILNLSGPSNYWVSISRLT